MDNPSFARAGEMTLTKTCETTPTKADEISGVLAAAAPSYHKTMTSHAQPVHEKEAKDGPTNLTERKNSRTGGKASR